MSEVVTVQGASMSLLSYHLSINHDISSKSHLNTFILLNGLVETEMFMRSIMRIEDPVNITCLYRINMLESLIHV